MKIVLDPGHGGEDSGSVGKDGLLEKNLTLEIALKIREKLVADRQCEIKLTRQGDVFVSLFERSEMANNWGADFFFSIHCNGHTNPDANGWETFIHPAASGRTKEYRQGIHNKVWEYISSLGTNNRGMKSANYHVLRETKMSAVLAEYLFITGSIDNRLLRSSEVIEGLAAASANGLAQALGLQFKENRPGTPILGAPLVSLSRALEWAGSRNAQQRFLDIAPTYWLIGEQIGIRPEVAYAQAAKETAFGRYGGVVNPTQNNWAGIKIREAVGDRPEDHETFSTPEEGVRGHFNHLAAYTGVEPLGMPHGRYYVVKGLPWAGTVKFVEELGGRWAPDSDYGNSIVRDYLLDLLKAGEGGIKAPFPDVPVNHWAVHELTWAREKKLLAGLPDGNLGLDEADRERKAELAVLLRRFYEMLKRDGLQV